jgi:hypothetical protein
MLTVGSGGCAAVGVVTELMDVEATLGIWVVTSDIPCNGGWGRLGRLLEGNGSGDLRVTSDGSNYNTQATCLARIKDDENQLQVLLKMCFGRRGLRSIHPGTLFPSEEYAQTPAIDNNLQ